MQPKIFLIKKESENSILSVNDAGVLSMSSVTGTSTAFLATYDMKRGVIFSKKKPFSIVQIKEKKGNKGVYFLTDLGNRKVYTSRPLKQNADTPFIATKSIAKDWECFSLSPITDADLISEASHILHFIESSPLPLTTSKDDSINLFWFKKQNGDSNFGDEINPYIISFLSGRLVSRVDIIDTDILGVGSILSWAKKRESKYDVWGSGTLGPSSIDAQRFNTHLLRGPLTASLLDIAKPIPYGDPGIIASLVWKASAKKRYKWGIIAHHTQENQPWVNKLLQNTPNSILIRTSNENLTELMSQISSCEAIASSSLHGLIIADSYNIPSIWLWENDLHRGGQWKFFDYFSGVGRQYVDNMDPNGIDTLSSIKIKPKDFRYFSKLERIKSQVISAFPL